MGQGVNLPRRPLPGSPPKVRMEPGYPPFTKSRGAAPVESSLLPPVFLGFPLHGRRVRVLELEPVPRSAAHIVRAETLADDAFETEPARVPEHDVPRLGDMLVQLQAKLSAAQELGERALALLDRLAPQVLAV